MGFADFPILPSRDAALFPGPGQYPLQTTLDKVHAPTLRGRRAAKDIMTSTGESVGPGTYDVKSTVGASPGGRFVSTSLHQSHSSSGTALGPKYDVKQYSMALNPTTPRFTFGSKLSPRSDASAAANITPRVPDPPRSPSRHKGESSTSRSLSARGSTFGIRPSHAGPYEVHSDAPGPGAYTVPRFADIVPKPISPPSQHTERADELHPSGPGPGSYSPVQGTIADVVKPRYQGQLTRGTLIGRNFPPHPHSEAPGPGAYDDPRSISSELGKKGVSILTKMVEFHDMDDIYPRPAPGDYAIPSTFGTKGIGKGVTIAARRPPHKPTTDVPGPGHVDLLKYGIAGEASRSARGIRFNGNGTFADGVKHTTPRGKAPPDPSLLAPEYDAVTPRAPAFSIGGRPKLPEADFVAVPGPGTYDVGKYNSNSASGPAVTFYRSAFGRPLQLHDAPGPGAYDATKAYDATHPTTSKSFGTVSPMRSQRPSPAQTPRLRH